MFYADKRAELLARRIHCRNRFLAKTECNEPGFPNSSEKYGSMAFAKHADQLGVEVCSDQDKFAASLYNVLLSVALTMGLANSTFYDLAGLLARHHKIILLAIQIIKIFGELHVVHTIFLELFHLPFSI